MRVNAETKEETRRKILSGAHKLFSSKGFEQTTTRQIAAFAGIATGTVFNYFQTKEALGVTLLAEELDLAAGEYETRLRGDESLVEDLFLYVAACLRKLEKHRSYLPPIVETALSPFVRGENCEDGQRVRIEHLARVAELLQRHGIPDASPLTLHLYWTLFLGVLAYWSRDASAKQEDTLALLDQSIRLFVQSITGTAPSENPHDA